MATSKKIREQPISPAVVATAELIRHIKLEDLVANPYQPETRIKVDPDTAKKFAYSIQEHGLIQMPVVRPGKEDGKYEVGDGWLRRAGYLFNFKEFGLQDYAEMPCVVKELTDQQMADMVMEANTIRKDLNPIELAKLYKKYLEDFKIPQIELARKHNCSQGEIANTIRLLELPADVQGKIISQEISETHGRQLLRLKNYPAKMKKMLQECERKYYSVNELNNRIQSEIFYSSLSLNPERSYDGPVFDVSGCKDCEHAEKIGSPYSSDKEKELRCLDQKCWNEKQKAAKAEGRKSQIDELAKNGITQVFLAKELSYAKFEYLTGTLPKECKTCDKRGARESEYPPYDLNIVCLDKGCYKKRADVEKAKEDQKRKEKEEQAEQEINTVFDNLELPGDHIPLATIDCLLRTTEYSYGRDRLLEKITNLFTVVPKKDKQKPTFKSIMALLRGMGEDELFYQVLPRLAFEMYRNHSNDSVQVKNMLKAFQAGGDNEEPKEAPVEVPAAPWVPPAGVRRCEDVPQEECSKCNLDTEDHTVGHKFLVGTVSHKVCLKDYRAIVKQERAKEFEVDKADLGEQELLSFQFKYCDGCHWADQAKVGTGQPCCTFITTPHIVDGECRTRKVKDNTSDNASANKDPLADLVIHTATDGEKQHSFKLGETEVRGKTLRGCVLALGKHMGWGSTAATILENLRNLPASQNSELLVSILEGENEGA